MGEKAALMEFHGSCGHTTTRSIEAEVFEKFAKDNTVNETADSRTVVVYPHRFCVCQDCADAAFREGG